MVQEREVLAVLGHGPLQLDVLLEHFVGHIPARSHKVTPRPQVPAPELPLQAAVLLQQMVARFAFDCLHDSARRQLGRHTQQQMDLVRLDMSFQNLDLLGRTDLSDQFPGSPGNIPPEDRLAVLGDKDKVVVQSVNRMGAFALLGHDPECTASPLKASPKGEGFPPPRKRQ